MSTTEAPIVKRGPSMVVQIGVLVVLTLVVAGAGWFSGGYLSGEQAAVEADAQGKKPEIGHEPKGGHGEAKGGHGEAPAAGHGDAAPSGASNVVDIPPITTNLAVPDTTWIRLEMTLVYNAPPADPLMSDTIQQDFIAYVRTVKLAQLEGASGYQHFKSDLVERANIRSRGAVKDVLIRAMLFE